jgi:hypothetical protein
MALKDESRIAELNSSLGRWHENEEFTEINRDNALLTQKTVKRATPNTTMRQPVSQAVKPVN